MSDAHGEEGNGSIHSWRHTGLASPKQIPQHMTVIHRLLSLSLVTSPAEDSVVRCLLNQVSSSLSGSEISLAPLSPASSKWKGLRPRSTQLFLNSLHLTLPGLLSHIPWAVAMWPHLLAGDLARCLGKSGNEFLVKSAVCQRLGFVRDTKRCCEQLAKCLPSKASGTGGVRKPSFSLTWKFALASATKAKTAK